MTHGGRIKKAMSWRGPYGWNFPAQFTISHLCSSQFQTFHHFAQFKALRRFKVQEFKAVPAVPDCPITSCSEAWAGSVQANGARKALVEGQERKCSILSPRIRLPETSPGFD
jgi:hypothetical protein